MKRIFFALALATAFAGASAAQDNSLVVMTFNLRYSAANDGTNGWVHRKDKVASQVLFHQVNLLGVQEALWDQIQDLEQRLPRYRWVGVGRDGGKKNEFSAIFFDTQRFELQKSDTFWLSETPEVPGKKGWDAALPRIVTWAQLKDKKTGKELYHFNTHFDHKGPIARAESAKLLLAQVNKIAGKTAALITGDFNSHPSDEPIRIILDAQNPLRLIDSKAISQTPHYGPTGTFNGFGAELEDEPIDYIFLKGKFTVLQHATISQSWNGQFASDHFSLLARLARD